MLLKMGIFLSLHKIQNRLLFDLEAGKISNAGDKS